MTKPPAEAGGLLFVCREDRIRTCDPVVPNHVFYRAELPPEQFVFYPVAADGTSENLTAVALRFSAAGLNYLPNGGQR